MGSHYRRRYRDRSKDPEADSENELNQQSFSGGQPATDSGSYGFHPFLNAYASKRSLRVERGLFDLVGSAVDYSAITQGAFDITFGTVIHDRAGWECRSSARGSAVRPQGSRRFLKLNPKRQSVRFLRRGVRIDLGGIAKGYAVDRIVDLFRRRGVSSAFVNFGSSSVYGLGTPPGRRYWPVPLMDPMDQTRQLAVARLVDQSLSSSGNYLSGRRRLTENIHVVDPATGLPNRAVVGAAVIAPSAVESEAFSTALCVVGCPRARDLIGDRKGLSALVFEQRDGPAWTKVVEFRNCDSSSSPFRVRRLGKRE